MYCFHDIDKVLNKISKKRIRQTKKIKKLMDNNKKTGRTFSESIKEIADKKNIELKECILGEEYTLEKCKKCVYR